MAYKGREHRINIYLAGKGTGGGVTGRMLVLDEYDAVTTMHL
jgi:hypothetical protein